MSIDATAVVWWCNFLEGLHFVRLSRSFVLNVPFFPPCSLWLIFPPMLLLFLQRNWSCASVDGSLLPPTALAELTMGEHETSAGAKPHPSPQLCTLLQLFSLLLLLSYIPALQLTHQWTWIYPSCGQTGQNTKTALWSTRTAKMLTTRLWQQQY